MVTLQIHPRTGAIHTRFELHFSVHFDRSLQIKLPSRTDHVTRSLNNTADDLSNAFQQQHDCTHADMRECTQQVKWSVRQKNNNFSTTFQTKYPFYSLYHVSHHIRQILSYRRRYECLSRLASALIYFGGRVTEILTTNTCETP